MKRETLQRMACHFISEWQHYSINALINMRYGIQKQLEPRLGHKSAQKWAVRIVMLFEIPLKTILC